MVSMEELLNLMVQRGGSDLHLTVGSPPRIRIDGKLVDTEYEPLMPEVTKKLVYSVLGADQVAKLEKELELDFSFGVANLGRQLAHEGFLARYGQRTGARAERE